MAREGRKLRAQDHGGAGTGVLVDNTAVVVETGEEVGPGVGEALVEGWEPSVPIYADTPDGRRDARIGELFGQAQQVGALVRNLVTAMPEMSEEQLVETIAQANVMDAAAFVVRGAAVHEIQIKTARLVGGRGQVDVEGEGVTAKIKDVAGQVRRSVALLRQDANIYRRFFLAPALALAPGEDVTAATFDADASEGSAEIDDDTLPREFYALSLGAEDPDAAIDHAKSQYDRAGNGGYTVKLFAAWLAEQKAGEGDTGPGAAAGSADAGDWITVRISGDQFRDLMHLSNRMSAAPKEIVGRAVSLARKFAEQGAGLFDGAGKGMTADEVAAYLRGEVEAGPEIVRLLVDVNGIPAGTEAAVLDYSEDDKIARVQYTDPAGSVVIAQVLEPEYEVVKMRRILAASVPKAGTVQKCRRCKDDKPFKDFAADKDAPTGRAKVCKTCAKELEKEKKLAAAAAAKEKKEKERSKAKAIAEAGREKARAAAAKTLAANKAAAKTKPKAKAKGKNKQQPARREGG